MRSAMDVVCGVILHGDNLGARLLASFGVELPPPSPLPLTDELAPDALALLDAAAAVATELGADAVGPEHVIVAAADGADPIHAALWAVFGITPALLREQLARLAAGEPPVVAEPDLAVLDRFLEDPRAQRPSILR